MDGDLKLQNVQWLRFFAAMLVLLYHFNGYYRELGGRLSEKLMLFGFTGLDLFFVISGVVIWRSTRHLAGIVDALEFLFRRAARIYPVYWIVLCAYLVACSWIGGPLPDFDVAGSFLLLPLDLTKYVIGPAWTLPYELIFYSFFALLICCAGRARDLVLLLALIAIAASVLAGIDNSTIPHICLSYFVEFILGCFAIKICEMTRGALAVVSLLFGALWLVVAVAFEIKAGDVFGSGVQRVFAFGPPAVAFVYAALALEVRNRLVAPRWLARTGDWSFSLYILHQLAVLLFLPLGGIVIFRIPITLRYFVFAGIIMAVVGVSALFAEFVDLPLYRWFKKFSLDGLRWSGEAQTPGETAAREAQALSAIPGDTQ